MGTHLGYLVVGIGSVAALVAWLCLLAGAEGETLGSDLDHRLPDPPAARASAPAPRPDRGARLRRVADPEYGLMLVAENEVELGGRDGARWLSSSATA